MGGGGFLSEAGLRERAQAKGRVSGAGGEGVRIWAFWLWDFGIIRNHASAYSISLAAGLRVSSKDDRPLMWKG